jgi:hypothetical protein
MDLLLNQQPGYTNIAVVEPLHTFLKDLPCCTEKDLYDLSLLKEPRGATAQQIAKIEAGL